MIDYISITKYNCKDSPYFGNCKLQGVFQYGVKLYYLEGCEKMKIYYNSQAGVLNVKGSLPYFLNGHNFSFSRAEVAQSVEIIDSMLGGVGLWGAIVDKFENGVIVPVDAKPKEYIARHYAKSSAHLKKVENQLYAGKFMMWRRTGEDIKLYDAGANILMKQGMCRRDVIEGAGWNPDGNYLKCEVRYLKPAWLNRNKPVMLESLQNESFTNMLKRNLMEQYHLLSPAKGLILPSDKKNFTSLDAVIYALAETLMNSGQGVSIQEAKKQVYDVIKQADCLSKSDKDARKRQIRKAFEKLEEMPVSRWDLTERIEQALNSEK